MNYNSKSDNNNKYKSNNKINLYKENLIKFIIGQQEKIILIGNIEQIDYIVGILFLTESNRYFKQNKINSHGYYLAYTFINLFNKIRQRISKSYKFKFTDITHFIISLSNNIDYFNSRIDPTNNIKNKINNNISKFQIEIIPILTNLVEYNKIHASHNRDTGLFIIESKKNINSNIETNNNTNINTNTNNISIETLYTPIEKIFNDNLSNFVENTNENTNQNTNENTNENINENTNENINENNNKNSNKKTNRFCDKECYSCLVTNILSKFFYLLLQTAKFLGSGSYSDPNLIRLAEYYANIFYTWLKSNDINFLNCINKNNFMELYENYLSYKNKLNYSLIEMNLSSETLDEIINYIDKEIIDNLSIKL